MDKMRYFEAEGVTKQVCDPDAATKTELAGASARIDGNGRKIRYLYDLLKGKHYTTETDTETAYSKEVAEGAKGAAVTEIHGNTVNDDGVLVDADVSAVRTLEDTTVIDAQDIPAAIRALPDWGKLGSKLIYENSRWMYYRYGTEINGGTKVWSKTSNGRAFSFTASGKIGGGAACVPYIFSARKTSANISDGEITINPSGNVMIRDAATLKMTSGEFKSYMNGKTIRYELDTPVEDPVDVTEMMPDIMLSCAEGATIEFTNANEVAVGNSVTYFVDIEEAI